MNGGEDQLVQAITDQVIAALRGGGRGTASSGADAPRAQVRPPVGICTGDYSKFVENRSDGATERSASADDEGDRQGTAAQRDEGAKGGGGAAALRGIVTASQIERLGGDVVRLAAGARLTPLAQDFVKERGLRVERGGAANPSNRNGGGSCGCNGGGCGCAKYLLWLDGHSRAGEQAAADLRASLITSTARRSPAALTDVLADLARRVKRGDAAGGVLLVTGAARAACFANRCPGLRAIVAASEDDVRQGVAQLAANVLIVDAQATGAALMRAIIRRFITEPRPPACPIDKQLKELATCA